MASISLTKVIDKFKWENLTPEMNYTRLMEVYRAAKESV